MKKIQFLIIILLFKSLSTSNQIEKNKILNILAKHNYDLIDQNHINASNYFSFPFSFNDNNETKIALNERELKKIFKKLRRNLAKDYSHSDWKKMNVKLLNDNIAIVNAMFSRINKNNESYYTGAALYSFRKTNNTWKIFSITPFKPYNYFSFD